MGNCIKHLCASDADLAIKQSDFQTVTLRNRGRRKKKWFGGGDSDDAAAASTSKLAGEYYDLPGAVASADTSERSAGRGASSSSTAAAVAPPAPRGFSDEFVASSATAMSSDSAGSGSTPATASIAAPPSSPLPPQAVGSAAATTSASSFAAGSSGGSFHKGKRPQSATTTTTISNGNSRCPSRQQLHQQPQVQQPALYSPHPHGIGTDEEGEWTVSKARQRMLLASQQQQQQQQALQQDFGESSANFGVSVTSVVLGQSVVVPESSGNDFLSAARSLDFSYLNNRRGVASVTELLAMLQEHESAVRLRTEVREEVARSAVASSFAPSASSSTLMIAVGSRSESSRRNPSPKSRSVATAAAASASTSSKLPPLTRQSVARYGAKGANVWVILRGHVYAVDSLFGSDSEPASIPQHCIDALRKCAGQDVTVEFESVHGAMSAATELLRPLCLGALQYT